MHTNLPSVTLVSPHRGGLPRGFDVVWPHSQHRDPSEEDRGWAPGPRVAYHMQRVVFAAVLADAEMVERALDIDVHAMCAAAVQAAAAPRGGRRAAGAGG